MAIHRYPSNTSRPLHVTGTVQEETKTEASVTIATTILFIVYSSVIIIINDVITMSVVYITMCLSLQCVNHSRSVT